MSNRVELGRPSSGKRRLKDLLRQQDNRGCADCGAPDPKWASANIGVFICLKCCGVHRSLGTHISKVLSVTLDEWSDEDIDAMIEVGGNAAANSIYEAYIPEGTAKPGPNAGHDDRMRFIRSKYELQEFLKPSLRIVSMPNAKGSHQPTSSKEAINLFHSSDSSKKPDNTEGMVEFIGVLKVKVVKGTNLAVRDMLSSDPYVLLNLGQQSWKSFLRIASFIFEYNGLHIKSLCESTSFGVFLVGKMPCMLLEHPPSSVNFKCGIGALKYNFDVSGLAKTVQTTVSKSNLNPVWNEELMLSVPQSHGPIKLQVFDYDTFSADDIMGEAEIDIQSLITSAMAYGDPGMFGDMQIGKWLKSNDNALIEDSTINIVNGTVKQQMQLKLQNVESGEIELELEWMPLDQ